MHSSLSVSHTPANEHKLPNILILHNTKTNVDGYPEHYIRNWFIRNRMQKLMKIQCDKLFMIYFVLYNNV